MKKILLSAFGLLIASTTFGQQQRNVNMLYDNVRKAYSPVQSNPLPSPSASSVAPSAIWEDDCSDPNTWVFTNTSVGPTLDWEYTTNTDIQSQCVTALPTELQIFNSTTASNGFMIINSDAAPGNTDNNGSPIVCEFTTATPIDLTAYPNVQLTYQHSFRWWKDTRGVRVSGDNGQTWTDFEISDFTNYYTPDQNSDNPHISTYDISAIAGGQSEVLVQFYYNDNDIWGWYWTVDDVSISVLPDNLVVSSEEVIGGWWINYQTVGGLGQDYTSYPLAQATANPYAFESVLRNGGIATQDATMYANVTGAGTFSTSSNTITLAAGEQDTVAGTSMFTPTATGLYNIEMWAVADSAGNGTVFTYTDTATKMSMVTDYIYGKDNGTNDGGYWRLNRIAPIPGGFEISSSYDIYADATLYSVDVHINENSVPGAEVYVSLYEEDISGGDPILLDQSDDYALLQSDIGSWVNIPFLSAQQLSSTTKMYRIAVGANIHPTDTACVDVSSAGDYYSADGMFDKDDVYANGTPSWYTIAGIPMLRMNFDPATGNANNVSDLQKPMFNLYPNPTNGVFDISLDSSGKYDLNVYNSLGQLVFKKVINDLISSVDLSNFDKGVYTVELKDKIAVYTDKIIVE